MGVEARAQPVTLVVPIHRLWGWWTRLTWPLARDRRLVTRTLEALSFIHFAHWTLVRRVGGRRLGRPVIVFETNYNGDLVQYIDAFALVVPWEIRGNVAGAIGYVDPRRPGEFLRFIKSLNVPPENHHYGVAYPDASVRTIRAALELEPRIEAFRAQTADLPPEAFARAWERFMIDVQHLL